MFKNSNIFQDFFWDYDKVIGMIYFIDFQEIVCVLFYVNNKLYFNL